MSSKNRRENTKSNMPEILVDCSEERRILDFRPLGFRDVQVLGRYRYNEAHPALPLHSHGKMIEICYLERGRQSYHVGDQEFELRGGDIFVTFPEELHGSGEAPEGKGVLYWVLIRVPRGSESFLSLKPADARTIWDHLLNLAPRQFSASAELSSILRQIMDEFERNDDELRIVKLQNLLLRCILDVLDASRGMRCGVSPQIRAVQDYIAKNLDQVFPIAQLARTAHMSESRFKARFKAELGVPPADYVMRQRIDRSMQLLRDSDTQVTQIAMALGFNSTQYFATVFKRYIGISPSEYRRQEKNAL